MPIGKGLTPQIQYWQYCHLPYQPTYSDPHLPPLVHHLEPPLYISPLSSVSPPTIHMPTSPFRRSQPLRNLMLSNLRPTGAPASTSHKFPFFFLIKKKAKVKGNLEGHILPNLRFSSENVSSSFCLLSMRLYVLQSTMWSPDQGSMAWSHSLFGGSSSKFSLSKTSLNSW